MIAGVYLYNCDIIWTPHLFYHHHNSQVLHHPGFSHHIPAPHDPSAVARHLHGLCRPHPRWRLRQGPQEYSESRSKIKLLKNRDIFQLKYIGIHVCYLYILFIYCVQYFIIEIVRDVQCWTILCLIPKLIKYKYYII